MESVLISFSVCIPTYNRGEDFIYTVQSVLNQTIDNWELIITDDSTSNNTEYLVKRLNHPKIKYYRNEHSLGLVKNWNNCLLKATNNYILILGHDDLLLPNALELYKNYLEDNPGANFIHANSYSANIPFFKKFTYSITQYKAIIKAGDEAVLKVLFNHSFTVSTVIISKLVIEKVGVFDTNAWVSPDFEYYARIGRFFDFHHIDDPTAIFIRHSKNTHISGYNFKDFISDNNYYEKKVCGYLDNYKPEYSSNCKAILNNAILTTGINLLISGNLKESIVFLKSIEGINVFSVTFTALTIYVKEKAKILLRRKYNYHDLYDLSLRLVLKPQYVN